MFNEGLFELFIVEITNDSGKRHVLTHTHTHTHTHWAKV